MMKIKINILILVLVIVISGIMLPTSCKKDNEISVFTVTFNGNGGTPTKTQVTVQLNERVSLPEFPIRTGYDMIGWYFKLDTTYLFDYEYARINANIELVARWKAGTGKRNLVTFYARGGKPAPLTQSVIGNDYCRQPLNPNWPDPNPLIVNAFKGWYTDSTTFTTAFNFKTMNITGPISLFAKWDKDTKK